MPRNLPTTSIIAHAAKTTNKPIIAACILFWAASTAALSPPEVIQLKPPKRRNIKAANVAITNIAASKALMNLPKSVILRIEGVGTLILISPWAKAGETIDRKLKEADIAVSFFIEFILMYYGHSLLMLSSR